MSVNPQASRSRRAFGRQLQDLREQAKPRVTQKMAGEAIGKSRDLVSFIERGGQWPTEAQLSTLLDLYGVDDATRALVEALYQAAQETVEVWWSQYPDLPKDLVKLIELEDVAEKIWIYGGGTLPGLLQIPEYIAALFRFESLEYGGAQIGMLAEVRRLRSGVLTRHRPLILDTLLAEGVLWENTGGRDVMRRQLEHLLTMARRPNVTIRIIPREAEVAASATPPFTLFDFHSDPSMRQADLAGGMAFTEDVKTVRYARRLYEYLAGFAATPEDSMQLIENVIKDK
ncbi:helix-turn-helix domain-containing protein [Streptomyces cinnamoneus]|uniref:helix-turn-helix domain-containing protein n=1 Tax=Streptomyces cinnamoneus TaxID=53446 RepID=UPI0015E3E900|nr:helix-turn-helix transcriptional regulator [Streptomyces cinnamoneus]